MSSVERVVVLTALFVPVVLGLLASSSERETAKRWLVTWLPLSLAVPAAFRWIFALSADDPLANTVQVFCVGVTAGLSFWAARCQFRHFAAQQ